MRMTEHLKNGIIKIAESILSEKGLIGLIVFGSWIALLYMILTTTPGVVETWKLAQEETTRSIGQFLDIQERQQNVLEATHRTLEAILESNEINERHLSEIERRLERIEKQAQNRQSFVPQPQTLPATDVNPYRTPTREDYERAVPSTEP